MHSSAMIPKIIILLLLTIEHILSEEIIAQTRSPTPSSSSIGATTQRTSRIAEERSASLKFATDYSITSLNGSSYQLHQKSRNGDQTHSDYISQLPEEESNPPQHDTVDDLDYRPVVRYETQNNHSQVRGQFVLGKSGVESRRQNTQQQSTNKTRGKSKGFIEFEFDIDGGGGRRDNNDETIEGTNTATSSLKQILSSILPQGIADMFRFSYVAEPPQTKSRHGGRSYTVTKPEANNQYEHKITTSSPLIKQSSELPLPQLPQPSPSVAPATEEDTKGNNSSVVTNEDVRNINNAAEKDWGKHEVVISALLSENLDQNYSRLVSPFGEPINADSSTDSDYEDHNLNLDEDNLIAPSVISSNQLFYPHPREIKVGAERGNSNQQKNLLSGMEKQINVQIIQDTLGGYGQKIVPPQTRHLDDFHEEVEKQFSPNDIRTDSEAASRKFLRSFKEKMNNKNQVKGQPRSVQAESLLHTYIYSSDTRNDSLENRKSYEAPPAGSLLQGVSSTLNSPSSYGDINQNSHTERDGLDEPSEIGPLKATQAEENREAQEISSLHTDVFLHNPEKMIFVTRNPKNEIDGFIESTTPYPRYHFKPPTIVEIQKSLNIHNKFITEKNGNLIEQHEIYSRPKHSNNSPGYIQSPDPTTQPLLSEHPIRVAQLQEESLQSETIVHPGDELRHQQFPSHQEQQQQEDVHQEPYEEKTLEHYQQLASDQQHVQGQQYLQQVQEQQRQPQYQQEQQQQGQDEKYKQFQNEDQLYQQLQQKQQQEQQYQQAHQQQYQQTHQEQYQQSQQHQYQMQQDQQVQQQEDEDQRYQKLQQKQEREQQQRQRQHEENQRYQQLQQKQEQEQQQRQEQQLQFQQQQDHNQRIKDDKLQEQYDFEYANYDQHQPKQQNQYEPQLRSQNQELMYTKQLQIEKLVPYPVAVDRIVPQPYPVEKIIEKFIDRPVHVERIVEKPVNVPYPVREVVEKVIDRPVPVEKIIDRPVHIPYPVQVDHFIDRPYPVQVPVAVPVPVPVHRYIDRPYPVEKIIEKPIHIPYPVEKIVEKVVEKQVPVEVERIVEKPVETIVHKHVDRPVPVKEFVPRPVPVPIPVPFGVPVAISLTKQKDKKNKLQDTVEDFLELVPPPLPSAAGINEYKTLPENAEYLLLDDYNRPVTLDHQLVQWNHPVKRGIKTRNIKRSPDFGRQLRVEYGFKPPLVPSLEIDDQGLPISNRKAGE